MTALAVNSFVHQLGRPGDSGHNARMHKNERRPRRTPLARLMAAYNNGHGINDNELARKLKLRGVPVTQSTITRIARGDTKDPSEATLRPLAEFFGVSTGTLRGAEPPGAREPRLGGAPAVPQHLTPEAVHVALTWMNLSPGRRQTFLEQMSWARFFESKFPAYRIGVANQASYERFERSVEADWETLMKQGQLPFPKEKEKR